MKRTLREATTAELIDAILLKDDIEMVQTDTSERCQIIIESNKKGKLPGHLYRSTGRYGPEVIIRYIIPPQEAQNDD